MAKNEEEKKEMWVGWTHDAASVYEPPDDVDDDVDDAAGFAVEYADAMLEEFEARFEGGGGRRRKRKTRRERALDEPD